MTMTRGRRPTAFRDVPLRSRSHKEVKYQMTGNCVSAITLTTDPNSTKLYMTVIVKDSGKVCHAWGK